MKPRTALVTGASSGIGRALARVLAREGYDLVVAARRFARLTALAHELRAAYGTSVLPVQADLRDPASPSRIMDEIGRAGLTVDVLVNDAGLGRASSFAEMPQEDIDAQLAVNAVALTRLTRLVLPGMLERRKGRILNVASLASYLPGPGMAIYYATKAFVLSLSEALWEETRGTGVTVTAMCPGFTRTEFHEQAHQSVGRFGWMSAEAVAEIGYRAMLRGSRVVNAGALNALIAWIVRFVPHRFLLFAGKVRRRR